MTPADQGLVTVAIPSRNEAASIGACLESILAQDYAQLEVLVVDGLSSDSTREIVRAIVERDARVVLIDNERRSIPAALNEALRRASGRYFIRVDAHSTIPPTYVSRVVARLASGRWGGVGGRKRPCAVTPAGRAVAAADGSHFGVGNSRYHYGDQVQEVEHVPFGAYPTALARAIGGWNEQLLVNEDFEFDQRLREAGHHIVFDPQIVIDWQCRQDAWSLFKQYMRYGRGKPKVVVLHPGSTRVRHLVPPALVAWTTAALVIAPFRPWALAALAPYLAALAFATIITLPKVAGWRGRLNLPLAFAAMHLGWGLGCWRGIADLARFRKQLAPQAIAAEMGQAA